MNLPAALRLKPLFLEKIWASPKLPPDLEALWSPPPQTGEVWLASDRHHVTAVEGGPAHGLGLDELVARWPDEMLGASDTPGFPLLVKILSVGQWLSVQVHPDDEAARRLENEPWGKSEAWHVLDAVAGAEIVHGFNPGVDADTVRRMVADNALPQVLAKVPATPGDTFMVSAGTVHTLGPGLTVFETQQASDVTYRFYDWDRPGLDGKPRPLHVDKALEVMRLSGPGRPTPARETFSRGVQVFELAKDPHFELLKNVYEGPSFLGGHHGPRVLFVLAGAGVLTAERHDFELAAGQTWLLPAGDRGGKIAPAAHGLTILESRTGAR